MSFPTKLKELRLSRNLTQEQLAELTGVTTKTIQSYESGKTVPRVPIVKNLAIALDASSDELLKLK